MPHAGFEPTVAESRLLWSERSTTKPPRLGAERGYSQPNEYFDSIKGQLSDSYSVIGQVWMLFIVTIQPWSLATMYGFNTPYHLKSHNYICIFIDTGSPSNI